MKLIAIDLDGTLLNSQQKISYDTKKYLTELKEEEHIIVLATGRNFKSAFLLSEGAFFTNYIVSSSGAAIYDSVNRKLLMRATIPFQLAQSILQLYHTNIDCIEFVDLFDYTKFSVEPFDNIPKKIEEMHNFLENKNNLLHICINFKDDRTAKEVNDYILKNFKELNSYTVHCTYDKKESIEILKNNVSKYSGIYEIAKIHNINNEDIIAIGDSENDIEMLKKSGVGVAMSNSFEIVKENANYITSSNDENGVVEFLKLYL